MANQHDWLIQPFAHRGLHDPDTGIIENTKSAFQAALDAGYGIELDVRMAGDGEVVVFHDATLDRLTTAKGEVSEHTVKQLKKAAFRNSGDRIQTLQELLKQVKGHVPLLIEIKTDWINHGPCERKVAAHLERYKGPAAVMSFDPRSITIFAREFPNITRGIVADRFEDDHSQRDLSWWQRFTMRYLLSAFIARPHFVNYDVRALPSIAPWIWKHIMRRPLLTWTVRSPEHARHAHRWADDIVFENIQPKSGRI